MIYTALYKICIFGDVGVGKNTLTLKYITNRFIKDTKLTIKIYIIAEDVEINKYKIKL